MRRTVGSRANAVDAPLRYIGRDFDARWENGTLAVWVGDRHWSRLRLGLRGRYQGDNAGCALAAIEALRDRGFQISEANVRQGLRRAKWPGRLEWHSGRPAFLFDAAHNAAGCRTLARYLEELAFPGRVVLLFGAMKDKDHRAMIRAFDDSVDRFVFTAPKIRRAESPERLSHIKKGTVARSVRDGISRAKRAAGPDGLVVVAGSIFLVAQTRELVKGVRTDPPIAM